MTSAPSLSRPVQRLDLATEGRDDDIGLAVVLDHASGALVDRAVGEAYLAVAVGGLEHVVLRQLFGRQHSLHETARTRDHGQIVDRGDRFRESPAFSRIGRHSFQIALPLHQRVDGKLVEIALWPLALPPVPHERTMALPSRGVSPGTGFRPRSPGRGDRRAGRRRDRWWSCAGGRRGPGRSSRASWWPALARA